MWYGDIGEENGKRLEQYIDNSSYKLFVDFGVRDGIISKIFLNQAHKNDGRVVGVDFDANRTTFKGDEKYNLIIGDSVSIASQWKDFDLNRPDVIAIDTTHIGFVTMCELYYLWPLLKPNGLMVLHDTCWPNDKMERAAGRMWQGVSYGLHCFFDVPEWRKLIVNNDYLHMNTYEDSWGMTFIIKRSDEYFPDLPIMFWEDCFINRQTIIESQMNLNSNEDWKVSKNAIVDLDLKP